MSAAGQAAEPDKYEIVTGLDQIRLLAPNVVFATGRLDKMLTRIEGEYAGFEADPSTADGREAIRSHSYRLRQTKTALDGMGKALTEAWRQKTGFVNTERSIMRERLDLLADRVRAPLTAFEAAEEARVMELEQALAALLALVEWPPGVLATAALIEPRLALAERRDNRDWMEFKDRHARISADVVAKLTALLAAARKREADEAELVQLRAEQAKRAQAQAAQAAAEADRIRAEQAAAAIIARERAEAKAHEDALVQRHEQMLQEAADRERTAKQRLEAAQQMANARERDEQSRVEAAVLKARQHDARLASERAVEAERLAAIEAKRTSARKHQAEVQTKVALTLASVGAIGEQSARKIVTAIVDGEVPHVALAY